MFVLYFLGESICMVCRFAEETRFFRETTDRMV